MKSKLINNKLVLVDDEDFYLLEQYIWWVTKDDYVNCNQVNLYKKFKTKRLHRIILGLIDENIIVDHKDCNPLNNQKINLRICNRSQNGMNRNKQINNLTSQYKGVSFRIERNKFRAYITLNKKTFNLGHFINEHDAAKAYNEAALKYHGEFARLNIIKD